MPTIIKEIKNNDTNLTLQRPIHLKFDSSHQNQRFFPLILQDIIHSLHMYIIDFDSFINTFQLVRKNTFHKLLYFAHSFLEKSTRQFVSLNMPRSTSIQKKIPTFAYINSTVEIFSLPFFYLFSGSSHLFVRILYSPNRE